MRLTVVSKTGKEATIGILSDGSLFGEGSLAGQTLRMGTATAMTDCAVLRIEKRAMVDTLHREKRLVIDSLAVPAVVLFASFIYAFGSVSVVMFFYVFHRAQS